MGESEHTFNVGDIVRIIKNYSNHGFAIGDAVEIRKKNSSGSGMFICASIDARENSLEEVREEWYVHVAEMEPLYEEADESYVLEMLDFIRTVIEEVF